MDALIAVCALSTALAAAPDGVDYDRRAFLEDSLRSMDLVVLGTPRRGPDAGLGGELQIEQVLYGEIHRSCLLREGVARVLPPRFAWGKRGIWILQRASTGYYAVNPGAEPLSKDEWEAAPRSGIDPLNARRGLVEHDTGGQLHRDYQKEGKTLWHGTSVIFSGELIVDAYQDGEVLFTRRWDAAGQLALIRRVPAKGPGFVLGFDGGRKTLEERFLDAEPDGVARRFDARTGRKRQEVEWKKAVRDGWARSWREDGSLEHEVHYQDGLALPIVHYEGKPGEATVYRKGERAFYSSPREVTQSIREGMTAAEVSQILKLDFSLSQGVVFPSYRCEEALHVEFQDGRVSRVYELPNGAHCQ
jgi:hypothetical protein